jgi:hypothetical protein
MPKPPRPEELLRMPFTSKLRQVDPSPRELRAVRLAARCYASVKHSRPWRGVHPNRWKTRPLPITADRVVTVALPGVAVRQHALLSLALMAVEEGLSFGEMRC